MNPQYFSQQKTNTKRDRVEAFCTPPPIYLNPAARNTPPVAGGLGGYVGWVVPVWLEGWLDDRLAMWLAGTG